MQIFLLIVLSIVLYIASLFVTARYLVQVKEPPKSVGQAGMAEAVFGTLLWGLLCFSDNKNIKVFILLLGFFWICIAISLYRGSRTGRVTCLVLSILRIPTIIGILFSLFSVYKLYFNQESKDFFDNKSSDGDNDRSKGE